MTECDVGDIVAVEFPFSDLQGKKRRPGLILAADADDVLLARLTTHVPRDLHDVGLRRWTEAGLPKPSTVRLTKMATVDRRLIHHRVGRLNPEDAEAVACAIDAWLADLSAALRK